jgi:glycine/D-amino acid oxidase-like deaminating enzyme
MSRFATRHAIIIGGGASGVLLACQLLQNHESADALLAWSGRQTPNTRACLDFLGKPKTEELAKIIAREEFSVSSRGSDAPR